MHREGHLGAAFLVYAPVGFGAYVLGFRGLAVAGAAGAFFLAMVPDWDMRVPLVPHRGPTHTVWFALLVGGVLGAGGYALGGPAGVGDPLVVGGFAFLVGTLTVCSHLLADALTPMGVRPFAPLSPRTYTVAVARAANPIANWLLLGVGATALAVALVAAVRIAG